MPSLPHLATSLYIRSGPYFNTDPLRIPPYLTVRSTPYIRHLIYGYILFRMPVLPSPIRTRSYGCMVPQVRVNLQSNERSPNYFMKEDCFSPVSFSSEQPQVETAPTTSSPPSPIKLPWSSPLLVHTSSRPS